jgi:triosephosphate isomerase
MNTDRESARTLAAAVAKSATGVTAEVGVAPPAIWLTDVAAIAEDTVGVWSQHCSERASGAFTGELSVAMLRSAGLRGSIVGHSERRALYGETSDAVGAKVAALRAAGLSAIACVGETLAQREAGETLAVVLSQLDAAVAQVESLDGVVIAYEPVWAIGTGRTASPAEAQEVHAAIRLQLRHRFGAEANTIRILYGGSVTGENAASLLAEADIDGALVGGASLKPVDFAKIIAAACGSK